MNSDLEEVCLKEKIAAKLKASAISQLMCGIHTSVFKMAE